MSRPSLAVDIAPDQARPDTLSGARNPARGTRSDGDLVDRSIDLKREPAIVSRDNKVFQSVAARWRRNRKNSIPSRSRRFNISGLRTISPTIEAILGARK